MKYNPRIHHRRSVRLRGYDYAKEGMYYITICTKDRVRHFGKIEHGQMFLSPFGEIAYNEWEKIPERWPHIKLGAFQIMPDHMHGILVVGRPFSTTIAIAPQTTPPQAIIPKNHINETAGATLVVAPNITRATERGEQTEGATTRVAPTEVVPTEITPTVVAPNPPQITPPELPFSKIQWATRPELGQILGAYKSIVDTACLKYHKESQPGVWLNRIWQRGFDERIIRNEGSLVNISRYIINNPENWKED